MAKKRLPGSSTRFHEIGGIWQKLLKLQTTPSILHTIARPDDEHADLLTYLSGGKGVLQRYSYRIIANLVSLGKN